MKVQVFYARPSRMLLAGMMVEKLHLCQGAVHDFFGISDFQAVMVFYLKENL